MLSSSVRKPCSGPGAASEVGAGYCTVNSQLLLIQVKWRLLAGGPENVQFGFDISMSICPLRSLSLRVDLFPSAYVQLPQHLLRLGKGCLTAEEQEREKPWLVFFPYQKF